MSLRRTNMRGRGLVIGLSAFTFALLIFLGSVFQAILTVDQARAESSVRPPANAVTNAPAAPGEVRVPDAVMPPEGLATDALGTRGLNSDATLWGAVPIGCTRNSESGRCTARRCKG